MAFSIDRKENLDFNAEPVLTSWSSVYVKKGIKINNIVDLSGLCIAILKDSIQQKFLEQMARGLGVDIRLVKSNSFEQAFSSIDNGMADAAIVNYYYGDYFHQEHGLEKTFIIIHPVTLHFAAARGVNNDLLKAIDKNLIAMKSQRAPHTTKRCGHG